VQTIIAAQTFETKIETPVDKISSSVVIKAFRVHGQGWQVAAKEAMTQINVTTPFLEIFVEKEETCFEPPRRRIRSSPGILRQGKYGIAVSM